MRRWTTAPSSNGTRTISTRWAFSKIDVLGLGMLSCLRKAFDLVGGHYGERLTLATIPSEDPAVYRMLQPRRILLGVFQVESRAQMTMLPRLQAEEFLRPGDRGGDRAAGTDPGRHGASLICAAGSGQETGRPIRRKPELEAVLAQDPGRAAVPGAGDDASPSSRPASRPPRPTGCAAPWRPSSASAPSARFSAR